MFRPRLFLLFALDDGTFEMVGKTCAVYLGDFGILSIETNCISRAPSLR